MTIEKSNTIKIMSCSPETVPGRPDLNTEKILSLMEDAANKNAGILLLPEAVLTGANLGRLEYDSDFAADVDYYLDKIIQATAAAHMPALFCGNFSFKKDAQTTVKAIYKGEVLPLIQDASGEFVNFIFDNATLRLHLPTEDFYENFNENMTAQAENYYETSLEKALFDENGPLFHLIYLSDSSVFSYRKAAEKQFKLNRLAAGLTLPFKDLPSGIQASDRLNFKNLPFSNLPFSNLPFIYVQRNALENNGNNIFIAEGSTFIFTGEKDYSYAKICSFSESSTTAKLNCETNLIEELCDSEGTPIEKDCFIYSPSFDFRNLSDYDILSDYLHYDCKNCFDFSCETSSSEQTAQSATEKNSFPAPSPFCHMEACFRTPAIQYRAIHFALKNFLTGCGIKRITIGISGGIDSALTAALYATVLPPEDILLINMPGHYNSETTKNIAYEIAKNIGCNYASIPIADFCDATTKQFETAEITNFSTGKKCKLELSGLIKENIQARDRGSRILAGMAAAFGGAFSCNANKAECTVGYGTFYGDIAGLVASIGDLWKKEVFALTRYLNEEIFAKEIIPEEIFTIRPSAELSDEQTVGNGGDPLNYAYHDKLLRAFTEAPYRRSLSELLQLYLDGKIDAALETGTENKEALTKNNLIETVEKETVEKINKTKDLKAINKDSMTKKLFPTVEEFCADLERWYGLYTGLAAAKRIQAPPVITLSMQPEEVINDVQLSRYIPRSYKILKEKAIAEENGEKI